MFTLTMNKSLDDSSCWEMFRIIFIISGSFSLNALFISIFSPSPGRRRHQMIRYKAEVYTLQSVQIFLILFTSALNTQFHIADVYTPLSRKHYSNTCPTTTKSKVHILLIINTGCCYLDDRLGLSFMTVAYESLVCAEK